MATAAEAKACNACARAKRRCGKQMPSCQRCKDKGIDCAYPPPKPNCFVLLGQPAPTLEDVLFEEATSQPTFTGASCLKDSIDATAASLGPSIWFLSPETWEIDHRPIEDADSLCGTDMNRFVLAIQGWLEMWVKTGSNPFIHSHLYRARFPGCVQIAYATLSAYLNRTESNTETILRVVDDQASELLMNNGATLENLGQNSTIAVSEPLSTLEHLARVHALTVYQSIGLFDGRIRSRHLAEGRIHILDRWVMEMVECAKASLSLLCSSRDPFDTTEAGPFKPPTLINRRENLWYTWIFAESVRRTWQVAKGLQGLYLILQQGWTYCPGGLMFTARQGIWGAQTAFDWEKLCSEVDVRFIRRYKADKFFTEAKPADIDEFGKLMLETTFGTERMERWN